MNWQAAAAVFIILGCIALWVYPGDENKVDWRAPDMKRWRDWRTWLRW